MDDQVIRLVLQTLGTEGIQKLRAEAADTKSGMEKLAAQFAAGEISAADLQRASGKLGREYEAQAVMLRRLEEANRAAASAEAAAGTATYELADAYELAERGAGQLAAADNRLVDVTDRVVSSFWHVNTTSAQAAGGVRSFADASRAAGRDGGQTLAGIQSLGYAFQDFTSTSGDLGAKLNSVTNNLPQLVGLLGATGGLGAALATVGVAGVAVYRNWNSIAGLWEDRQPIATATAGVDGLTDAVKKNEAALDKLRDAEKLNATQRAEYNRLTAEGARLERELTEARRTEANRKAHGENSDQESKDRAQAVGKALDQVGGYDAVVAEMVRAALKSAGRSDDAALGAVYKKEFERQLNLALEGNAKAVKDLRIGADASGNSTVGAFGALAGLNDPQNGRDAKKAKAFNDLSEELNKAGELNEGIGNKKVEDEAADAKQKAVAAAKRSEGEDLTAAARDDLADGIDPAAVKARLKALLAARLKAKGDVPAAIRDAVAEAVVDSAVDGISAQDVARTRAAGATRAAREKAKAEAQAGKDGKALESGLGDRFLAEAEARRASIEADDSLTPRQRAAERARFQADLRREARRKLILAGEDPERATDLAGKAGGFVDQDIRRQLGMLGARPGNEQAGPGDLLGQLVAGLRANLAAGGARAPAGAGARGKAPQPPRAGRVLPLKMRPPGRDGAGFRSVNPDGPGPDGNEGGGGGGGAEAFAGVAGRSVGNTARLIGVAGQIASKTAQLAAQQDAQAQQIERLSSFVGGPRARTASPRGR